MGKDLTRSVYLIDTENQHDYWMKHIKSNTSNDKVILFCSVNSPRVTFQLMQTLYTSFAPRQVEYVETYPGKNSQDFFIIGKLGQLITTAPKSKYYIVSEDKGYDAYLYSLVEQGYKTFRLEFSSADVKPSNTPPSEDRCKSILLRTIDTRKNIASPDLMRFLPHSLSGMSGSVSTLSEEQPLVEETKLEKQEEQEEQVEPEPQKPQIQTAKQLTTTRKIYTPEEYVKVFCEVHFVPESAIPAIIDIAKHHNYGKKSASDAKAMVNEMTILAARASGGVWTGSKKTKLIQDFSQDGRNNLIIELRQF